MDALTLAYIAAGVITLALATGGATYAFRSLNLLRRNPEIREVQQKIWLPILTSGALLTIGAALDALAYLISIELDQEMLELIATYAIIAGTLSLLLGISRYWRLWKDYDLAKRRASEQSVAK